MTLSIRRVQIHFIRYEKYLNSQNLISAIQMDIRLKSLPKGETPEVHFISQTDSEGSIVLCKMSSGQKIVECTVRNTQYIQGQE